MLMLYPIAAILFGGVQLAAIAMAGSNQNWFSTMLALLVMGAPLFMLPFIARQAGPMLGKLNSAVNGMSGKLRKPVGDWAGSHAKLAKASYDGKGIRLGKNGKPILRDRARALRRGFQERSMMRDVQTAAHHAEHTAEFNEKLAEGAAALATGAGLGKAGEAYLTDTADTAMAKTAEMHKKVLRGKGAQEWLRVMKDSTASKEERMAAAGLLASSGSRAQQLQAIQAASDLHASGDTAAGAIQKQMLSEMGNRVPFALGDQDRAEMMTGDYKGNIYENLARRAETNLTPEKLANMDIDELRELADMSNGTSASGVTLTPEQRKVVNDRIGAVEADDILKNSIAKRDRDQYARLGGASGETEMSVPHDGATNASGQSYPTAEELEATDAAVRAQMRRDGRYGTQVQQQQRQEDIDYYSGDGRRD